MIFFVFFLNGFCLSSFSIGGLGRRVDPLAAPIEVIPRRSLVLGFSYIPEFCVIKDDNNRRLVSELSGFYPYLRVPFFFNLDFLFKVNRYFDQNFDIYSSGLIGEQYRRRVIGKGGINSFNFGTEVNVGPLIAGMTRYIFFGSSEEEWIFEAEETVTKDTIKYSYDGGGWQFQSGLLFEKIGIIGWGGWHDIISDTLISTPFNIGIKMNYQFSDAFGMNLSFGYESWEEYSDQINLGAGFIRGPWTLNFAYIPWYTDIDEYDLSVSYQIPAGKVGRIIPGIRIMMRRGLGVTEYSVSPSLQFQLEELIRKRKRWF